MRIRNVLLPVLLACASTVAHAAQPDGADAATPARGPAVVRIVQDDGRYRLLVDGKPFHVRGAGMSGDAPETLAARGGNSFRTWDSNDHAKTLAMLDRAHKHGLMVAVGIDVARERHGFDYDDKAAVAAQRARIRAEVLAYKDHPAVLMWLVGNELNLESTNPAVWDAVGALVDTLHDIDPNHPVMTTLAGFDARLIGHIKKRAASLDLIGIQLYGDIEALPQKLRDSAWTGPYIVTEWGPTGHWESPLTAWGVPVEDDASRKAQLLQDRYQRYIVSDRTQSLGSYVFLWGQKQERTPTWYGLFLASGESTPGTDAMQFLWTGRWPENRSPSIAPIRLDGRTARDSITLKPGQRVEARVDAADPEDDPLAYRWTVREESRAKSTGGDAEQVPPEIAVPMTGAGGGTLRLTAPDVPGHYRLFVEVRDGKGHAAYANLPFRVR